MLKISAVLAVTFLLALSSVSALYTYGNVQASAGTGDDINANAQASANTGADTSIKTFVNNSIKPIITLAKTNRTNRSDDVDVESNNSVRVKIMPSVASAIALMKLQLHACTAENNCTIVLKNVGNANASANSSEAYEVQVDKEARIFGIFKKKMHIRADIDASTGEVIDVEKPWWAALASESDTSVNATANVSASSAAYK